MGFAELSFMHHCGERNHGAFIKFGETCEKLYISVCHVKRSIDCQGHVWQVIPIQQTLNQVPHLLVVHRNCNVWVRHDLLNKLRVVRNFLEILVHILGKSNSTTFCLLKISNLFHVTRDVY